ncbi:MAG: nucleotide exchange factor GrpE [Candidatus Bathyarchaeota archaeon]|nr:nucleotide exchange factor GrpE [Candidatus Bathyarchaeum sp.]
MTKTKKKTSKPSGKPVQDSKNNKELEQKIKQLEEQLVAEQQKSQDYLTKLKYLQADFENFRRRSEKHLQDAVTRSNESLVSSLIVVIDDFENAISAGEKTENKDALLEGIKMVHKKLDCLLVNEGLERLECVGKQFDPIKHEVLAQIPTNDHESGTVIEEARKGFVFKGKVLRPSVVTIACENSKGEHNE